MLRRGPGVAESGEGLGWNRTTLAVAGDSSGGTFAAAIAALAHDEGLDSITHQVLYYPSLDLDFDADRYPSLRENAVGYGLETAGLKPFNAFYSESGADPDDPRVSPIKRTDLTRLPPALIITAEHDPLRDEGELYGQRLQESGVPAIVTRYPGAGHGFVQHFSSGRRRLPRRRRAATARVGRAQPVRQGAPGARTHDAAATPPQARCGMVASRQATSPA